MNVPESISSVTGTQNLIEYVAEPDQAVIGDYLDRLDIRVISRTWNWWRTTFDVGDLLNPPNYFLAVQRLKCREILKNPRNWRVPDARHQRGLFSNRYR